MEIRSHKELLLEKKEITTNGKYEIQGLAGRCSIHLRLSSFVLVGMSLEVIIHQ